MSGGAPSRMKRPSHPPPTLDTPPAPDLTAEFSGLARLLKRTGCEPAAVEKLPGDVGRRRYVRIALPGGASVLGVAYPPEEADSRRRWVAARAALDGHVRVPRILADDGEGHQLVEDLGSLDLASRLATQPEARTASLADAVRAVSAIAALPDPGINPPFDFALFRRELELAREAVFDLLLASPLSEGERAVHDRWADALCREILGHPQALAHRDFHGNNLFPFDGEVAAIDFQDMRSGPDTYDVASLLWERTTLDWMTPELAHDALAELAARRRVDAGDLARRLDRVLLQRAWKVCGTFARAVAQGRGPVYRQYLPGELALVRRLLSDAPEDAVFRGLFEARLRPLLS